MDLGDLDLRELLTFEPKGGVMRFASQRVLLMDAVSFGLLRKELIELIGLQGARGVLTRFGYAHGRRLAETMRGAYPWPSEREWQRAGGRLHMLHGMVVIEPGTEGSLGPLGAGAPAAPPNGPPPPFAEATWHESYEAEQHLLHQGRAEEPVCWSLAGFASGYLSYSNGREVYCIEDRCVARGDAACHLVGRFKEDWGDAIEPHLGYYQAACLDATLEEVRRALRTTEKKLQARKQELARLGGGAVDESSGIIVSSEAMRRVLDLARRVAQVESTVLVSGESGVGKERVARLIHDASARAQKPFVAINCGAISETLLESELFGHVRGAFTGAERDRPGLFEAASGGTLFLDEVGEVSPGMQVKLLRALQEREIRRVGDNRARPVDVRVVAATNRNLAEEVSAGRFRQDLYYRLRVVELKVPPLRDRPEDVLPLARLFLADCARRTTRIKITGFTPRAADQLLRYDWPGNVRELENAVEHAVALATSPRIDIEDLPEELRSALPRATLPGKIRPLEDVEREYILAVVQATGGNKSKAASELKIGTATLFRKLKEYDKKGHSA
jgi:DNA-binding NtrC family response regulator